MFLCLWEFVPIQPKEQLSDRVFVDNRFALQGLSHAGTVKVPLQYVTAKLEAPEWLNAFVDNSLLKPRDLAQTTVISPAIFPPEPTFTGKQMIGATRFWHSLTLLCEIEWSTSQ